MEILTVEPPEIQIFSNNCNVLSFCFLLLLYCFVCVFHCGCVLLYVCVCFMCALLYVCFALCVFCFVCTFFFALFYISIDPIFRYLSHSGYSLFVIQCIVKQNIDNFIIFNLEYTIFVFRNLILVC